SSVSRTTALPPILHLSLHDALPIFEDTMSRDIEKQPTVDYLWNVKRVVPFLKVDEGLDAEKDGVQLMKPMPKLAALLDRAKSKRSEEHTSELQSLAYIVCRLLLAKK